MNYYPFHIGDYLSATRHLSWEEDAAFRRLLDTYYTTEKPLPADLRSVCRLVLATTDSQREAVRIVLEEFFTLTADGWINARADNEISAMREKQQKQRDKANKRWHKPEAAPASAPAPAPALPQHDGADAAASKVRADAVPPTPTPTPTPYSVANATDGDAVSTAQMTKDELWAAGKSLLVADGLPEKQCGSFVGKLSKDYGAEVALEAVRAAVVTRPADVREYLLATCKHMSGQRQRPNAQEALEAANRAVAERFLKELDHASH